MARKLRKSKSKSTRVVINTGEIFGGLGKAALALGRLTKDVAVPVVKATGRAAIGGAKSAYNYAKSKKG